ncbi:hypothetical protein WR25_24613 [Diploscapter pachys]|uniref:Uncharacterized protein n=1 Tax=Diploscapter pachys TaxID=2018661 RepID=A0A2A2M5Z2_9BILA|nr:hypothetical protein WR25_24613 [Diploscapter pachys]
MLATAVERIAAALRPAHRAFHRRGLHLARRGGRNQFVERHHDIGAQKPLDLDRSLRAEQVARAVEVALERHALFGSLGQVGEAHHLIAA